MNGRTERRTENGSTETISELTAARLRRLAGRIPPDELSEVWVFPPLDDIEGSDEFHLFTRRMSEGVYRVCAAEFPGDAGKDGAADGANGAAGGSATGSSATTVDGKKTGEPRVTVYGAVPESRVPRLVAGFRDRLGDGREPLYLPIYGSLERWRLAVGVDAADEAHEGAAPEGSEPLQDDAAGGSSVPTVEAMAV